MNAPLKMQTPRSLIEVSDLRMHFPITKGFFNRQVGSVKAVDDVSFDVIEGESATGACLARPMPSERSTSG